MIVSEFDAGHDDIVHDLAYDYHGERLVSCSADQRVRLWERDDASGEWRAGAAWKAHDAPVLKSAWAHPEFGHVFATASLDRTIRVWEEHESDPRRWLERARIVDSRTAVQWLEFAPSYHGLKLASVSADGVLRVHEALDIVDLAQWTLLDELEAGAAPAARDGDMYSLSWLQSRFTPATLAVTAGGENTAKIFRQDQNNKWVAEETLPHHSDVVYAVAFAPNMGRSYELIATGCKDGHLRIFKLTPEATAGTSSKNTSWAAAASAAGTVSAVPPASAPGGRGKSGRHTIEMIGDFDDHESPVRRVEWNVMGTVLCSTGDDGKVRFWRASYLDEWKCVGVVSADGQTEDAGRALR